VPIEGRRTIGSAIPRLAVVLWTGALGGAELATLTLARFLRTAGADVRPVFVGDPGVVGERFRTAGFRPSTLGATPGSRVILGPRRAAAMVRAAGPDGAILVSGGILAAALRLGGYTAPLVAVEHGGLAQMDAMGLVGQARLLANWTSGARLVNFHVGVSRFVVDVVRRHAPGCRVVQIPNGIDPAQFAPVGVSSGTIEPRTLVVACAGRLISGKGIEHALQAAARVSIRVPIVLRVAGDGPLRTTLALAADVAPPGLTVEFLGWCESMPDFWRESDIAIVPTAGLAEGFGMTALEAMASGLPVIASDSGGLAEVVSDGVCGVIYPAGDVHALSNALLRLATDPACRRLMGEAARARVLREYDATIVAREYLGLFTNVDWIGTH